MKKYKDVVINVKENNERQEEIEKLAQKLNISKKEMEQKLNNMYIMKGAKYEEYFRT